MKLMLDECFLDKKLRKKLNEHPDFDAKTSIEMEYKEGESDKTLVAGTKEHSRLLVTKDFRTITEDNYPPCQHGGILRFPRNKLSPDYVFQRLEALKKLRLDHRAVGHFTYFSDEGIKIVTHKEIIERKFKDYEDFRDITLE